MFLRIFILFKNMKERINRWAKFKWKDIIDYTEREWKYSLRYMVWSDRRMMIASLCDILYSSHSNFFETRYGSNERKCECVMSMDPITFLKNNPPTNEEIWTNGAA